MDEMYKIHVGDCREVLNTFPENFFHSVVTDPPYELGFMGKSWDNAGVSFQPETWAAIMRVLKPGGHLLAFGGSRTYHRIAVAIEDAGFEIRDTVMWLYGCLSEDTEILVDGEWVPYHEATQGRLALCYNVEHDTYSWQPIEDLFVYDYCDTAYRITSDRTDQLVSRNHRCFVERGGGYVFEYAETLEREAAVPVLEGLSDLLGNLPLPNQGAGDEESLLLSGVRAEEAAQDEADSGAQGPGSTLRGVRDAGVEMGVTTETCQAADLFTTVQRGAAGSGMETTRAQGPRSLDRGLASFLSGEDDGSEQSGLEGWRDLLPQEGQLQADQVRALPGRVSGDGSQGQLRDGASLDRRAGVGTTALAERGSASREPRQPGQSDRELVAVPIESRPQAVRASRYTRTDLARVEPVHYEGVVWCVKVPTGAFVARRNGKVFVTGNSGFPKSHDVSKAIDKAARGVPHGRADPTSPNHGKYKTQATEGKRSLEDRGQGFGAGPGQFMKESGTTTADRELVPEAQQWDGWGTALKPAHEPIIVARKPFKGTVANNVLEHGTGALNIDGCRVSGAYKWRASDSKTFNNSSFTSGSFGDGPNSKGRWPANVILDEEAGRLLDEQTGDRPGCTSPSSATPTSKFRPNQGASMPQGPIYPDNGGASRFFYCAKASKKERGEGNTHPTVKPLALMRYLVRLVTPPDGYVLDPFCGSGSTLIAALEEGFHPVGIEMSDEYVQIAEGRISARN